MINEFFQKQLSCLLSNKACVIYNLEWRVSSGWIITYCFCPYPSNFIMFCHRRCAKRYLIFIEDLLTISIFTFFFHCSLERYTKYKLFLFFISLAFYNPVNNKVYATDNKLTSPQLNIISQTAVDSLGTYLTEVKLSIKSDLMQYFTFCGQIL